MENKDTMHLDTLHPFKKPLFWGSMAGVSLLIVYFLILTVANSFSHSIEQFKEMWYWILVLVSGFGIQAGLYTHIRWIIKMRKHSGVATTTVAAAGGVSTTSMIACCAHHLTDILPILGISAAVVFLGQYQNLFIMLGVLSNLIGITLMLKIIQKHSLYTKGKGILPIILRLDMQKSFYLVCIFSIVIFLTSLYKSI
jgi:predicted transporter